MYVEIYVHPSLGNDDSYGTGMHPYRTVNKAVSVIYEINNKLPSDEECNINIMLGCGVNKISSPIVLENLKPGMNLKFRPWDDMYTTLSCAVRISGFDFKYDNNSGLYTYESSSDEKGLYINGKLIDVADSLESVSRGCAHIEKNIVAYNPQVNESLQYSLTELAGKHDMFKIKNCKNIIFENIDFTGIGDIACSCITLDKCSCIDIRNCKFNNLSSRVISCVNGSENINVCDCEFMNVKSACVELSESSFIRAENNYFDSCYDCCIRIQKSDAVNVISSTFQNLLLPVCDVNYVSDFSFEKNRIINYVCGQYVLFIEQGIRKIKICGNYVSTEASTVKLFEYGKIADYEEENVIGVDNVIVNQSDDKKRLGLADLTYMDSVMETVYTVDNSDISAEKAAEIINSAGYRKLIKNYGDII